MAAKADTRATTDSLPSTLAEVALVDAPTCAVIGGMSVSWWNEQVRTNRAPQPVVRGPRLTRWRLTDVRNFWADFAERSDVQAAERLVAQATKASAVAKRIRASKDAS